MGGVSSRVSYMGMCRGLHNTPIRLRGAILTPVSNRWHFLGGYIRYCLSTLSRTSIVASRESQYCIETHLMI